MCCCLDYNRLYTGMDGKLWGNSPASGSAGRSDSLFLDARELLTGTGKNPRRKRVIPITSDIKISVAKTDERTFIMPEEGSTQLAAKDVSHNG